MKPARIVSGGQTGVDRAALDAALSAGIDCGGWCPPGRASEAGTIPNAYPLRETPDERSPAALEVARSQRTEWNVRDSDGTLVLRPRAAHVDPGTEWSIRCAFRFGRPLLVCDPADADAAERIREWLAARRLKILHVAGPSEESHPGIGANARRVLDAVFA